MGGLRRKENIMFVLPYVILFAFFHGNIGVSNTNSLYKGECVRNEKKKKKKQFQWKRKSFCLSYDTSFCLCFTTIQMVFPTTYILWVHGKVNWFLPKFSNFFLKCLLK